MLLPLGFIFGYKKKKKNHLPKCELERGEEADGGVLGGGGGLNRVPMLELVLCLKTISF